MYDVYNTEGKMKNEVVEIQRKRAKSLHINVTLKNRIVINNEIK